MKKLPDSERLQAAQALIDRMVKEFGVAVVVNQVVRRIDDGSVLVVPQINLGLIEGWKAKESE